MTLGWLLCSAEHLTLKQAQDPSSQYESWAAAFLPELNTWLDVCKAQRGDVLVGIFKPPLIVSVLELGHWLGLALEAGSCGRGQVGRL